MSQQKLEPNEAIEIWQVENGFREERRTSRRLLAAGLVAGDAMSEADIDYECVPIDYVHWSDFGHSLARTWEEVKGVWPKVYMAREELEERFGPSGDHERVVPVRHLEPKA